VHAPTIQRFSAETADVVIARRFAALTAADWGVDPDDIELVVGELAANAVLHARTSFTVSLTRTADCLVLVEVADLDAHVPSAGAPSLWDTSGRGLMIVSHLTEDWGVRTDPSGGKVIWARIRPAREGTQD
jgi:hypothetical protein